MCVDSGKYEGLHNFAAGQSSEIGRYEVPREESLSGLGIIIIYNIYIAPYNTLL